ncbi:MAG TPA: hypothetical protein VD886_13915 [Herpetosiphonaceae bacterium]|nr:hypothetical protein [Herpetosiphonaceae bacterium]
MRRWVLMGVLGALALAGCGKTPAAMLAGQWRAPSMGLVTFAPDGWMYIHDEQKLVCWQIVDNTIRINDPGGLPSEIPLDLSFEDAMMKWQYNGEVVSFDRVDAGAALPEEARRQQAESAAAGRTCQTTP